MSRRDEQSENVTNEPITDQVAGNAQRVVEFEVRSRNAGASALDNVAGLCKRTQALGNAGNARAMPLGPVTARQSEIVLGDGRFNHGWH